jgi:hypothetical protein
MIPGFADRFIQFPGVVKSKKGLAGISPEKRWRLAILIEMIERKERQKGWRENK